MELAVYFAHVEQLETIQHALLTIDTQGLPGFARNTFFDDVNSREYLINLAAVDWLEAAWQAPLDITRLYFGQEFCQHLIPEPDEVLRAYYSARQLGWHFTYVTGSVTNAGLAKTRQNLRALANAADGAEVVVNDWGVLSVLRRDFPAFTPVLGRLLIRQQRLGRFSAASPPPVNMERIEASESEIRANQLQVLRDVNLSNTRYRERLRELGIRRFDLDIVPQGIDLPSDAWGFGAGCYFPWTYITGGRNCLTASITDARRGFVVVDGPCPKPCQTLNQGVRTELAFEDILLRGNTAFTSNIEDAEPYLLGGAPIDRTVLEPYIPI